MSKKYYYFVASLPSLSFGAKPPMPLDEFLASAEIQLEPQHYNVVRVVLHDEYIPSSEVPAYRLWNEFDNQLRNELAFGRAKSQGYADPNKFVRGQRLHDPSIVEVVQKALKEENPRKSVELIDRARWNMLTEMGKQYLFDFKFIVSYALRLRMLYSYQKINSERGKEIFDEFKDINLISEPLSQERI